MGPRGAATTTLNQHKGPYYISYIQFFGCCREPTFVFQKSIPPKYIMSFQFLFFSILCSSALVQIVNSIAGFDGLNHKRACKKHYCAKGYVAVPLKHLKLQAGGCDSLTNSMGGSFGQNDNSKRALEPCCNLYVLVFANFFFFFSFLLLPIFYIT